MSTQTNSHSRSNRERNAQAALWAVVTNGSTSLKELLTPQFDFAPQFLSHPHGTEQAVREQPAPSGRRLPSIVLTRNTVKNSSDTGKPAGTDTTTHYRGLEPPFPAGRL